MTAALKVVMVPLDDLVLDPDNVRRHDDRNLAVIARSLDRFGQQKPIVALADRTVVAGNGTVEAARSLGWADIGVVFTGLDGDEARAYAAVDNRSGELASWDEAALVDLLEDIDPDLRAAAGWDDDEFADLLGSVADAAPYEGDTDPDAHPGVPTEVVSCPGDVWILGDHRLAVGDATDVNLVERLMDGVAADLVWTDPPYGVNYRRKIANDDLGPEELEALLRGALTNAFLVSRPGASWYVAAPSGPQFLQFATVLTELEVWRQTLAWVKDRFVLGRADFHGRHESVLYGWRDGDLPVWDPAAAAEDAAAAADDVPDGPHAPDGYDALIYGWKPGEAHSWFSDRRQDTVLEFDRPSASKDHPTMKPVELVEYCLRVSSRHGAVVLDPFAGSGTTLLAAHRTGRIARVVELDPAFADVVCRRWQDHTGGDVVLEATGDATRFV